MRLASMAVRSDATSVPASAPMAADSAQPSISIVPDLMPWRPSVMMTTFSGLRPSIGRMSVRSITAPATKAKAIERRIARTTGMPVVVSFHETNAENSAISPWAKLRTPVVRKISTSARATEANTTPLPRPLITWLMNSSIRDPSESQVGLADGLVVVQLVGRALHRDTTGLEHVAPVADVECEVGVLLDHQDGQALVAVEVAQPGEQLAGDQGGEAERRLVEQQQAGPGHHRPGEGEHLLLATAHAAGLLRAALAQTGEHVVPTLQVAPDLAVTAVDRPDAQVVLDRQVGERAPALGDVGDAEPRHGLGALAHDRRAVEADVALDGDEAADGPERGGLARAVGAEHHGDVAHLDRQVDVVEHGALPVATGDVVQLEQAHAGAPR